MPLYYIIIVSDIWLKENISAKLNKITTISMTLSQSADRLFI